MKEIKPIQQKFKEDIQLEWIKQDQYSNPMAIPRVVKVVVNMGLGYTKDNEKDRNQAVEELRLITGQTPLRTTARKAISAFGIREGMEIGAKVTLRGNRMYQFLDKVFNFVLPQTRDFRGLPSSGFDGQGNYSFGLEDQMVFLEIDPNKTNRRRGLQITIVTNTNDDQEAEKLLRELGLPLQKGGE